MEQKFEQVMNSDDTPEKYLYQRRYKSACGEWTTGTVIDYERF